jgi:hypothetical protein
MASEPDFLAQNQFEVPGGRDFCDWLSVHAGEAKLKGASWYRCSHHQTIPGLYLFEGWHVRPVDADGNLDEGEPRWPMSVADGQDVGKT